MPRISAPNPPVRPDPVTTRRPALPGASSRAWVWAGLACVAAMGPAQAQSPTNNYPTVDRVLYVQECMRNHPGPHYEMVNKCACALDRLAAEVPFDDYVEMSTAQNANSIGGERGNSIRDTEILQNKIRKYRGLQAKVQTACFITR